MPTTPKEHYQKIYFEAFELIIKCITERFDQEDLKMYDKLQNLFWTRLQQLQKLCNQQEVEKEKVARDKM